MRRSAAWISGHIHSVSSFSHVKCPPPAPQLDSGSDSTSRGGCSSTIRLAVLSSTAGRAASPRRTAFNQSTPSNHQWPKSSVSYDAVMHAEFAGLLVKLAQLLLDQVDVMVGVRLDLIGGALRVVRLLAAEVNARPGYPPVLHAGFSVLAVKLAVHEVAGVAECRRPDLLAGPLVPGQDGDLSRGVADPVGAKRGSRRQLLVWLRRGDRRGVAPGDHAVRADRAGHRHADRAAAFDGVGFAEEDEEPFLGEERFQAGPAHGLAALIFDDRGPVGALGQPDRLRRPPETAAVGFDAGVKLPVDRGIAGEERQVAVGGGAGGDLDRAPRPASVRNAPSRSLPNRSWNDVSTRAYQW